MDAEQLDFADGSFDVVLCGFGIMFFPDQNRALSEFRRVLKPGGTLAVSTWKEPQNHDLLAVLRDLQFDAPHEPGWISDHNQLERLIAQAQARYGKDFWGFWMMGGMAGGGMGFIFDPFGAILRKRNGFKKTRAPLPRTGRKPEG